MVRVLQFTIAIITPVFLVAMIDGCGVAQTAEPADCAGDPDCADAEPTSTVDEPDSPDPAAFDLAQVNPIRPLFAEDEEEEADAPADTHTNVVENPDETENLPEEFDPPELEPLDSASTDSEPALLVTPGADAFEFPANLSDDVDLFAFDQEDFPILLSLFLDGLTLGLLDPALPTLTGSNRAPLGFTFLELVCLDADIPDSFCRRRFGR
ncbi:MAG: hypothetical protein IIC01_13895 [Planctomycetes bacterium]|nr:hypothetical protein [Planctomycetota bacterium]